MFWGGGGSNKPCSHVVDLDQSSYGDAPNAERTPACFLYALARITSIKGCEEEGKKSYLLSFAVVVKSLDPGVHSRDVPEWR